MSHPNPTGRQEAVEWAVALGCTTAARLGREWDILDYEATIYLVIACKRRRIERVAPGVYGVRHSHTMKGAA